MNGKTIQFFKDVSQQSKSKVTWKITSVREAAPSVNLMAVSPCTLKLHYEPPHNRFHIVVKSVLFLYLLHSEKLGAL